MQLFCEHRLDIINYGSEPFDLSVHNFSNVYLPREVYLAGVTAVYKSNKTTRVKNMAEFVDDHDEEIVHNATVDTSAFLEGDLDLFYNCLLQSCGKNLKKKTKKRGPRASSSHRNVDNFGDELNASVTTADPHHNYYMNETENSFNTSGYSQMTGNHDVTDTDLTYLCDQFSDIFRYFDEDVVPDNGLFEEEGHNDDGVRNVVGDARKQQDAVPPKLTPKKRAEVAQPKLTPKKRSAAPPAIKHMLPKTPRPAPKPQEPEPLSLPAALAQPVQQISAPKLPPKLPSRTARGSRSYGPKKNGWSKEYRELQHKSNAILDSIKANEEFHGKLRKFQKIIEESSEDSDYHAYPRPGDKLNQTCVDITSKSRTFNDLLDDNVRTSLSSSCLSICETDSDGPGRVQSIPYNNGAYVRANVRAKIQFFNDSTSTSRSSSASPLGSSEDDECELYRRNSKRSFQLKRQYFEKFLNKEQSMASTAASAMLATPSPPQSIHDGEVPATTMNAAAAAQESGEMLERRLQAVEQFVQTRHILERIQILIKAISKLDEKRLSTMNLGRLKKFLLFIRDASYRCQEVCFNISEEFLQGFENNVVSAEELLFSAYSGLTEVHIYIYIYYTQNALHIHTNTGSSEFDVVKDCGILVFLFGGLF